MIFGPVPLRDRGGAHTGPPNTKAIMGEMCDFEAEFFPQNWPPYNKRGKSNRVNLTISLSKQQREKVRLIGGVAALRKMIDAAPVPIENSNKS